MCNDPLSSWQRVLPSALNRHNAAVELQSHCVDEFESESLKGRSRSRFVCHQAKFSYAELAEDLGSNSVIAFACRPGFGALDV